MGDALSSLDGENLFAICGGSRAGIEDAWFGGVPLSAYK
jgi:hypothetical protein